MSPFRLVDGDALAALGALERLRDDHAAAELDLDGGRAAARIAAVLLAELPADDGEGAALRALLLRRQAAGVERAGLAQGRATFLRQRQAGAARRWVERRPDG